MKGYRYGRKFIFGRKRDDLLKGVQRPDPGWAVDADFDDLELATLEAVNETRGKLDQQ